MAESHGRGQNPSRRTTRAMGRPCPESPRPQQHRRTEQRFWVGRSEGRRDQSTCTPRTGAWVPNHCDRSARLLLSRGDGSLDPERAGGARSTGSVAGPRYKRPDDRRPPRARARGHRGAGGDELFGADAALLCQPHQQHDRALVRDLDPGLLKYWRDSASHGGSARVGDNEAYTSLVLLLRFAIFVRDRWEELALSDSTPRRC